MLFKYTRSEGSFTALPFVTELYFVIIKLSKCNFEVYDLDLKVTLGGSARSINIFKRCIVPLTRLK